MAIKRKDSEFPASPNEYRRKLLPFVEDESGIKALQRLIGPDNQMTREGMYLLEILNNIIQSQNGTEKVFQRIPPEVFGGLSKGGRRNVQASLIGRTVQGTDKEEQRRVRPSGYTLLQELIGSWSERDGSWSDYPEGDLRKQHYNNRPEDDGSEARVFSRQGDPTLVKTIDFSHYSDFELMLDRITIHNAAFPEMAMKVEGFGIRDDATDNSGFVVIISQPKAQGVTPTMEQITDGLAMRDFDRTENGMFWINRLDNIVIADVHDQNCVVSPKGHLLVFDCEAFLKLFPVDKTLPERYELGELLPRSGRYDSDAWKEILGPDYPSATEQEKSLLIRELRRTGKVNGLVNGMTVTMKDPEVKFARLPDGRTERYYDGPVYVGKPSAFSEEHLWSIPGIQFKEEHVQSILSTIHSLMPVSMDLDEFLFTARYAGDVVASYKDGGKLRRSYRDQLRLNGRIDGTVNRRYLVQTDPQDKSKVLISDVRQVAFMLWTNNTENDSLGTAGKLTPQEKMEILKGNTLIKDGKEIYFNLDKGRLDSCTKRQMKLSQKVANDKDTRKQPVKKKLIRL